MKRTLLTVAVLAAITGLGHAGPKPDVPDMVTFAKTWKAAVEEARLLNVPIVVHRHLFT